MKDITIKAGMIKRELLIFLVCIIASIGLNIYSIIKFKTDWSEIVSQLPIILGISIILYILVGLFRLIFLGVKRLTNKTIK